MDERGGGGVVREGDQLVERAARCSDSARSRDRREQSRWLIGRERSGPAERFGRGRQTRLRPFNVPRRTRQPTSRFRSGECRRPLPLSERVPDRHIDDAHVVLTARRYGLPRGTHNAGYERVVSHVVGTNMRSRAAVPVALALTRRVSQPPRRAAASLSGLRIAWTLEMRSSLNSNSINISGSPAEITRPG